MNRFLFQLSLRGLGVLNHQPLRSGRLKAIQFEFKEMNGISRTFFRDFYTAFRNTTFIECCPMV